MAKTEVQELLSYLKEVGGLTLADISRLIEKPRQTVWTWDKGRTPKDYIYKFVIHRLTIIKTRCGGKCLIKPTVSEHTRQAHVSRLKHELFGFSTEDTTN